MKQIQAICIFALLTTPANVSYADATITYSNEPDVLVEAQTIFVQNGKVIIKSANNDNTDLIYEAVSDTVFVVNHNQKTVMRITEQAFSNLTGRVSGMVSIIQQQLEAQMGNMSPEEQAQMRAMMQGMGLANIQPAETAPATLQAKGNAVHAGIACTLNSVVQENQIIAEVCLSKGNNIGIAEADYQALIGMQNFIFKIASATQQFSGILGDSIPSMGDIKTDNLIIQGTKLTGDRNSMIIIGISSNSLPAETIAVPASYTEELLPSLSDLM